MLNKEIENWEKVKNSIYTRYTEFKSLKDPLCEDDIYCERIDIISNRWTLVLERLHNNSTQLNVSLIRCIMFAYSSFVLVIYNLLFINLFLIDFKLLLLFSNFDLFIY